MKFALVNGYKTEPQPKLHGICAHCHSETVSKCGDAKVWHWAHKNKLSCDIWWENETEWHRVWKNHFPTEWQEISHSDPLTGEKHIADIKTENGLVIEFQHSAIQPTEMKSREAFYKNMIWVVDGTRLKRDYPRFHKGLRNLGLVKQGVFLSPFPEESFPASWLTSSVPVYFDFQGMNPIDESDWSQPLLWGIFPNRVEGRVIVAAFLRKEFIESPHLLLGHEVFNMISEYIQEQREKTTVNVQKQSLQLPRQQHMVIPMRMRRPRRYRRF